MAKEKKIIVGNWKMNPGTFEEARAIFSGIKKTAVRLKKTSTVICPPVVFLSELATKSGNTEKFSVGGQDAFFEMSGAFTGEVSSVMLKNIGAKYVIIGHSERRNLGETDDVVNRKILSAIKAGLNVIFCIGERERDKNVTYLTFLKEQIRAGLARVNRPQLKQIIVAYEPVWAIGKDSAMSAHDLEQMAIFIRRVLADIYGVSSVTNLPILYGGSVSPQNTRDLITIGKVAGLLVGRESRDPKSFSAILKLVDSI